MLARLLAVADDVDPGILLQLDREQRGVILGGRERPAATAPKADAALPATPASAGCRRWWSGITQRSLT
jgi:hypothetical protein